MKRIFPSLTFLLIAALAAPSWAECEDAPNPSARYQVRDHTVLDQNTALEWARCSVGLDWKAGQCEGEHILMALDKAKALAATKGNGWRVPTVEELFSLTESACGLAPINATLFPDVLDLGEGAPYWTSTPIPDMPELTYYIDFIDGSVDGHTPEFSLGVRLVRTAR